MSFTRRQILGGLVGLGVVGLGAGGTRYWLGRNLDAKTHDYELIAAPLDLELVSGHVTPAWAYGGQAPGVELRSRQGDWLRVRFINKLDEPTTIHWHGIRLPLEMDGVPYVSQLPVLPGEYFDYRFRTDDAGSFWYHPHLSSAEQLGRGLVGPLIVEEREPSGFRHERVLSLKTWHVDEEGAFTQFSVPREAAAKAPGAPDHHQRHAGTDPGAARRAGGAPARAEPRQHHHLPPEHAGRGGAHLFPGRPPHRAARAGQGVLARPGHAHRAGAQGARRRPGTAAAQRAAAPGDAQERGEPGAGRRLAARAPANPVPEPDLEKAETLSFKFEWAATLTSAAGRPSNYWQINGKAWDIQDKTCADRPIATLKKGGHYIFELRNMAQYLHPIHLHGMAFKVIGSDRKDIVPYFTDTYLLGKNETARIALVADNPGVWMFHCHVIDHMETGLMAAIEVA